MHSSWPQETWKLDKYRGLKRPHLDSIFAYLAGVLLILWLRRNFDFFRLSFGELYTFSVVFKCKQRFYLFLHRLRAEIVANRANVTFTRRMSQFHNQRFRTSTLSFSSILNHFSALKPWDRLSSNHLKRNVAEINFFCETFDSFLTLKCKFLYVSLCGLIALAFRASVFSCLAPNTFASLRCCSSNEIRLFVFCLNKFYPPLHTIGPDFSWIMVTSLTISIWPWILNC